MAKIRFIAEVGNFEVFYGEACLNSTLALPIGFPTSKIIKTFHTGHFALETYADEIAA